MVSEQGKNIDLWHQRLEHLGEECLQETISKQLVKEINASKQSSCHVVKGALNARKSFKPVGDICSTEKLQLVHSNVCGPMPTESISKKKDFVTFTDDFLRCCSVYFMSHKSEVLEMFKEF